mmetsp:Transcript_34682/g.90798  ORF Transcript_34682/g.90798 Transcript_34682/m.90798 type:complete len:323 (+) Transcript_34682:5545-6513(+)
MRVDDDFGQPHDLTNQVEGIPEPRPLPLLCRQRLDWLEVEVVVEMEVVQVLTVNKQVQHVVPLAAHLQTNLDPVKHSRLKEFGCLERPEEVPLLERLGAAVLEAVQHVNLEHLLVRHADFGRLPGWAVLEVPRLDEGHINRAAGVPRPLVERVRRPVQVDAIGRVVRVERLVRQQRPDVIGQRPPLILIKFREAVRVTGGRGGPRCDWVDQRVEVERREIRVLRLDVHNCWVVVHREGHALRERVVQVRKRDAVLGPDVVSHDDLVDVVELIPVLVAHCDLAVERFKLGPAWDGLVEGLRGVERLEVKEIEVVLVGEVREQL